MVELISRSVHGTAVSLHAHLTDGALHLVGVDSGAAPRTFLGFDEYEYTTTVAAKDVPRVRDLLAVELGDATTKANVLKLLQRAFQQGKFDSDSAFRKWLRRKGIKSTLFTWP